MADKIYNTLFLCTHNSARSVLAEAYLNSAGRGRFKAFSAGSFPTGRLNPVCLDVLRAARLSTEGFRSKSWDEFAAAGAPQLDFVITVCDQAAGEACPVWPGQPITAHWGFPDPSAFKGSTAETHAFAQDVFRQIRKRIDLMLALPVAALDRLALKNKLDEIGRSRS